MYIRLMAVFRFSSDKKTIAYETKVIEHLNASKHILTVLSYIGGDDRDHWRLKCTNCHNELNCSIPYYMWQPSLDFCPYCSDQNELCIVEKGDGSQIDIFQLWDCNEQNSRKIIIVPRLDQVE